jgi:hypothetical protein
MAKKKPPAEGRGRCSYCGQMTGVPKKASYDGLAGRYPHHRRLVQIDGVEILPLCELAARARRARRRVA